MTSKEFTDTLIEIKEILKDRGIDFSIFAIAECEDTEKLQTGHYGSGDMDQLAMTMADFSIKNEPNTVLLMDRFNVHIKDYLDNLDKARIEN